MGDLLKVDFTKLVLPEWKQRNCVVRISAEDVTVEWMLVPGWVAKKLSGVWLYATDCSSFDELLELKKVSEKVDAFIATELKKLEPDWVEVKWTEVDRLRKAGVHVPHTNALLGLLVPHGDAPGVGGFTYHVDVKTVPAGVNLYEPEWIDVPWQDVERLQRGGARVQVKPGWCCPSVEYSERSTGNYELIRAENGALYRADRKTCPDGYRPTVGDVAKPLHATIKDMGILATLATNEPYDTSKGVHLGGVLAPGTWKFIAVRVG
jgi:hypothetical protein